VTRRARPLLPLAPLTVLAALAATIALTACGAASGAAVHLAGAAPGVAAQAAPPTLTLSAAQRRRYEAFRSQAGSGPPLILVYHDVEPRPDPPYTVTPAQLASHLAMLRAAGFTPVTAQQVTAWVRGRPLPPRSVLVTFDDSTKGTWVYGDPVLAAAGFHAASFVITGWVGTHQPYYLTWDELARMQASGRWDLESHSRLGHQRLPVDAAGQAAPALINRLWLAGSQRLETIEEFQARVRADLEGSRADLTAHGLPRPTLFAYPFSAAAVPTNDPAAPAATAEVVQQLFGASLVDSATNGAMSPDEIGRHVLRRLDVGTATTTAQLFDLVRASTPAPLRSVRPFGQPQGWLDHAGGALGDVWHGESLALDPGPGAWRGADFDAGKAMFWSGYVARLHVGGLAVPGGGGFGGLRVLVGDPSQLQVSVSGDWLSVRRGQGDAEVSVLERPIHPATAHDVAVSLGGGRADVIVDGTVALTLQVPSSARGGVGVMAKRADAASPVAVLSALSVVPGGGPRPAGG
jgi:biofilm PGA synthesis lipoprotein PgaB